MQYVQFKVSLKYLPFLIAYNSTQYKPPHVTHVQHIGLAFFQNFQPSSWKNLYDIISTYIYHNPLPIDIIQYVCFYNCWQIIIA